MRIQRVIQAVGAVLPIAISTTAFTLWRVSNDLLYPARRPTAPVDLPAGASLERYRVDGALLEGWRYPATTDGSPRRGAIIVLHSLCTNRQATPNFAAIFNPRGWDVIGYDSRAHGNSIGGACTYGYWEKRDVRRIVETLPADGKIVLIGMSMGGAVAIQAAAIEPRVSAVVSFDSISDFREVVREQTPGYLPDAVVHLLLAVTGRRGNFDPAQVSPRAAAAGLRIPVLIIHGQADTYIPAHHGQRLFAALPGPDKRLILVPGDDHGESVATAWNDMVAWIEQL